jgi:hypothetical protein
MENEPSTYPAWISKPVMLYIIAKGTYRALKVAFKEAFGSE